MPTNPYINLWSSTAEQSLIRELTSEAIKMHGFDIVYLPVNMRKEDTFYNEDILRNFTETHNIEVYINEVMGWTGSSDFLSKFGLRTQDKLTVMIARNRWAELIPTITRPYEGDLVYFPAPIEALFEIKFVEHEKQVGQFYPLGTLAFYRVELELHTYNQENIDTGNTVIDLFEKSKAYSLSLEFASGNGSFTIGETVYQGPDYLYNTASGVVTAWSNSTNTLTLVNITGEFGNTGVVTGITSNAAFLLIEAPDRLELPNDNLNDNRYIATQEEDVVDRSERNPISGQ